MKLDLRRPSIVLLGAWNPAILQPGWIANYLREIPEGKDIAAQEAFFVVDGLSRSILYIDDVGITANNQRVDIFLNSFGDNEIHWAEKYVSNLVTTLKHTPLGAYGINFSFVEEDAQDELLDMLKTKDKIEQHFKILNQSLTSAIEIDANTILNFSRKPSEESVIFEFNFHHNQIEKDNIAEQINGKIKGELEKAKEILNILYGIDMVDYGYLSHEFNKEKSKE